MKHTRNDSGDVIEVKGCTTCPHMEHVSKDGENFMQCRVPTLRADEQYRVPTLRADEQYRRIKKKLVGKWTGAYHASCPLSSDPANVSAIRTEVPK